MPKPVSRPQSRMTKWWNRQERTTKAVLAGLSAIAVLLVVAVVLVATLGTRGASQIADASSTTLAQVAESDTTSTAADDQAGTTSTGPSDQASTTGTTTADQATTSTTVPASSTTTATATSDTADHAAEFKAQYPSTDSFTNSNWANLDQAPGSHLGAAVDVVGRSTADPTLNGDTGYLTWQLSVPGGGKEVQALCRTNVNVDRSLLSAGAWVEVRGVVVGSQASGGSGAIIYVESIQRSTEPAVTPTS